MPSADQKPPKGPTSPPPAANRRRAERMRTFIKAAIVLPEVGPDPWECVVMDLSGFGCSVYFEEHVPPHAAVLLTLPGLKEPASGRVVADRGDVKHVGFAAKLDVTAILRAHAAQAGPGAGKGG